MKLFVRVKAAGKRKDVLQLEPIEIPEELVRIKDVITFIVKQNVNAYNNRQIDAPLFKFLSNQEIADLAHIGKISFGDRKNEAQQDEQEAIDNAWQCYQDGIYRVLINDQEILESTPLQFKEQDVLTFIKLTMLAGRMW